MVPSAAPLKAGPNMALPYQRRRTDSCVCSFSLLRLAAANGQMGRWDLNSIHPANEGIDGVLLMALCWLVGSETKTTTTISAEITLLLAVLGFSYKRGST